MTTCFRAAFVSGAVLTAMIAAGVSASAAPSVPSGCSFDRTTGISTCTTTTPINYTQSAISTGQDPLSGYSNDGSPAGILCTANQLDSVSYRDYYDITNDPPVVVTAQGTQVTTTTYQGAAVGKGKKPVTTTVHSTVTYTLTAGVLVCLNNLGDEMYLFPPDKDSRTPGGPVTITT